VLLDFFAKRKTVPPYEMFSLQHFILVSVFAFIIFEALRLSKNCTKEQVTSITKKCAAILWSLEFIKITFVISTGNLAYPGRYLPLYFCSIPLYCSLFSSFGKGKLKRVGDVFLTVGGIIGGGCYMISPSTTAGVYPMFHLITTQSFILHSIMIYLSLLYIKTGYCKLKLGDWKYYALTVTAMCAIAYGVNSKLGTNLMFVSKNFKGSAVEILFNMNPSNFPINITLIQAIPPFFAVYGVVKALENTGLLHRHTAKEKRDICSSDAESAYCEESNKLLTK